MTPFFKGGHMKNLQIEFTYTLNLEVDDKYIMDYLSVLSQRTPDQIKAFIDDGVYIQNKKQTSKVTGFKYKVEDL